MTDHNRTPEQGARAAIDTKLERAGLQHDTIWSHFQHLLPSIAPG